MAQSSLEFQSPDQPVIEIAEELSDSHLRLVVDNAPEMDAQTAYRANIAALDARDFAIEMTDLCGASADDIVISRMLGARARTIKQL